MNNSDGYFPAACQGKAAFTSPQMARAQIKRQRLRGKVVVYHCQHCGRWHYGGTEIESMPRPRRERRPGNWRNHVD